MLHLLGLLGFVLGAGVLYVRPLAVHSLIVSCPSSNC